MAICSVTTIQAQAGDIYIEGRLGTQLPQEIDVTSSEYPDLGIWNYEPTKGLTGAGAIGMYLRPNIRVEADLSYMKVTAGDIAVPSGPYIGSNGETIGSFTKTRLMFNALYDFHGLSDHFIPFVGVGLGWSWYDLDNLGIVHTNPNDGSLIGRSHFLSGRDSHFTYALHVGADIPLRENLSLTTRYTLSNRSGLNFTGTDLNPDGSRRPVDFTGDIESGVSHGISIGLKYKFNRPERETYKN